MPLFDYRCVKCEHVDTRLAKDADPNSSCTECGSSTKRLIGGSNFHLKGSGWYETDFSGKVRQPEVKG